nr:protein-disulfide reductase DsbD N-terminal domain-containing protein [Solimonas terrae]
MIRWLGTAALGIVLSASARPFERLSSTDDLLPAAQAFSLLPVEYHDHHLHLSWNIAPGYYLYRQRIRVEVLAPSRVGLQAIRLPQGIAHVDEHFGSVQIYRELLDADVPTIGPLNAPLRLRVSYQGCADAGVCYPPQTVVQTIRR